MHMSNSVIQLLEITTVQLEMELEMEDAQTTAAAEASMADEATVAVDKLV